MLRRVVVNDETGCWEYQGSRMPTGYGRVQVTDPDGTRRVELAHRVVFAARVGAIPDGRCVLHSCDNPPCVNPMHLRVGTPKDNADDREERGRGNHEQALGRGNGRAVLTADDVRAIRRRASAGERPSDLADEYGMSRGALYAIVHRRSWRHLD